MKCAVPCDRLYSCGRGSRGKWSSTCRHLHVQRLVPQESCLLEDSKAFRYSCRACCTLTTGGSLPLHFTSRPIGNYFARSPATFHHSMSLVHGYSSGEDDSLSPTNDAFSLSSLRAPKKIRVEGSGHIPVPTAAPDVLSEVRHFMVVVVK